MKKIILISFISLFFCSLNAQDSRQTKSQKAKAELTGKSIVKDSTGVQYPFFLWQPMLTSGEYTLAPADSMDKDSEFYLYKINNVEDATIMLASGQPPASRFFHTGANFSFLKTEDINGAKVNSKGKILVLNYWFVNCPPCRQEIPKLNELAREYEADSSVLFVAIATDNRERLRAFLRQTPFNYHIISDGRYLVNNYRINAFPTHAVINKEGKVVSHFTGYGNSVAFWLRKTIEESR